MDISISMPCVRIYLNIHMDIRAVFHVKLSVLRTVEKSYKKSMKNLTASKRKIQTITAYSIYFFLIQFLSIYFLNNSSFGTPTSLVLGSIYLVPIVYYSWQS